MAAFIFGGVVLGLFCCTQAFSSYGEQGLLFTVGFSSRWLLLQSTGSKHVDSVAAHGFGSCTCAVL